MSDHAGATFLGSPNHAVGRRAFGYVVMHTMVGSEAAANARFQNAAQQASANYGVCLDGRIVQWVHEADTAWANGTYYNNPGANVDSISIEHEDNGDYNGPRTPALYEASARLVADICKRRGIPLDRAHIIKHRECFQAATACPDSLDVDGILARAQLIAPPSGIGHGADPGNLPGGGFLAGLTDSEQTRLYNLINGIPGDATNPGMAAQMDAVHARLSSTQYKTLDDQLKAAVTGAIPAGAGVSDAQMQALTTAVIAAIKALSFKAA